MLPTTYTRVNDFGKHVDSIFGGDLSGIQSDRSDSTPLVVELSRFGLGRSEHLYDQTQLNSTGR